MHLKPIHKIYIKDKPIHYKINKIINRDKTYMNMQENTLKKFKLCKQINMQDFS